MARKPNTLDQAILPDLITFTGIVEQGAQVAGYKDSTQNAAYGLILGWEALNAPGNNNTMPALRDRVADYLASAGAVADMLNPRADRSTIARLAAPLMTEIYSALPERHQNNVFWDEVRIDTDTKTTMRTMLMPKGRKIMKAARTILGTDKIPHRNRSFWW